MNAEHNPDFESTKDTLAAILRDAISELNRDCYLDTSGTALAVRAGEIVRRAMDRAVNASAQDPDDGMLLEMWAGHALQGLLANCWEDNDAGMNGFVADAFKIAEAMLTKYRRRRTAK